MKKPKAAFWCDCSDRTHVITIETPFDDDPVYLEFTATSSKGTWRMRIRDAYKALFKPATYVHESIILGPEETARLYDFMQNVKRHDWNLKHPDLDA